MRFREIINNNATTRDDRVICSTHVSTFNYVHDFQKSEMQPAFSHRFSIAARKTGQLLHNKTLHRSRDCLYDIFKWYV